MCKVLNLRGLGGILGCNGKHSAVLFSYPHYFQGFNREVLASIENRLGYGVCMSK